MAPRWTPMAPPIPRQHLAYPDGSSHTPMAPRIPQRAAATSAEALSDELEDDGRRCACREGSRRFRRIISSNSSLPKTDDMELVITSINYLETILLTWIRQRGVSQIAGSWPNISRGRCVMRQSTGSCVTSCTPCFSWWWPASTVWWWSLLL